MTGRAQRGWLNVQGEKDTASATSEKRIKLAARHVDDRAQQRNEAGPGIQVNDTSLLSPRFKTCGWAVLRFRIPYCSSPTHSEGRRRLL